MKVCCFRNIMCHHLLCVNFISNEPARHDSHHCLAKRSLEAVDLPRQSSGGLAVRNLPHGWQDPQRSLAEGAESDTLSLCLKQAAGCCVISCFFEAILSGCVASQSVGSMGTVVWETGDFAESQFKHIDQVTHLHRMKHAHAHSVKPVLSV